MILDAYFLREFSFLALFRPGSFVLCSPDLTDCLRVKAWDQMKIHHLRDKTFGTGLKNPVDKMTFPLHVVHLIFIHPCWLAILHTPTRSIWPDVPAACWQERVSLL